MRSDTKKKAIVKAVLITGVSAQYATPHRNNAQECIVISFSDLSSRKYPESTIIATKAAAS